MKLFKNTLLNTVALFAGGILSINSVLAEGLNGPHTHGTLEVSIHKSPKQLVFDMVVPAENIVGFEREAKTKEEKKRLKDADTLLYTAENLYVLFDFFPKDSCLAYESYINSDLLNIHSHPKGESLITKMAKKDGITTQDDVHSIGKDGHADFVMSYVFNCEATSKVSLNFATLFPGIKKINIHKKNIDGKVIQTLKTDKNTTIKLKDI